MPLVLLSALAIAAAAPPPKPASPRPASAEQEIVVTGVSLESSERALRECLARKCPPKEDIAASLADAENLFVGGKYDDAFRVNSGVDRPQPPLSQDLSDRRFGPVPGACPHRRASR